MRLRFLAASLAAAATGLPSYELTAQQARRDTQPTETRVEVGAASLYARTIGQGHPLIVLHGGPDFDSGYLLPELDRLADTHRLIYYDQRGRGRSAAGVRPEDVTMVSEVSDLEQVRQHFQVDSPALLGHSWGALLALEYVLRFPTRVSHLILMNPAPVSARGLATLREAYLAQLGEDVLRQRAIIESEGYRTGDPAVVTARHRIHFKHALHRTADYERLMARMDSAFHRQGSEGILKARAVDDRLMRDTWQIPGYDLLPALRRLRVPTLVIAGEHDFIPTAIAEEIARSIPDATLVTIEDCGHFAYLECADRVREVLRDFFATSPSGGGGRPRQ